MHTEPMPAIGGLAMFIGFLVALRHGPAARPLRPAVRPQLRAGGRRCWRRRSSSPSACSTTSEALSAPAKVTGTVVAGLALVWFGVTMFYFRLPFLGVFVPLRRLDPAGHRALAARDDPGDQPDRRPRRARRRHRRHRRRRLLPLQPAPHRPRPRSATEHRTADGDHRRRAVPRLPAAQLQPGADHHGRLRRLAARAADGGLDERRRRPRRHRPALHRPDVLLPRPARRCRCSSSACPCSTCCSPSSAGPRAARRSTSPTRAISTTA